MTQVKHRVHVVPWLRRPGSLLLKEWLAITIGRDIFCWRDLNPAELNHRARPRPAVAVARRRLSVRLPWRSLRSATTGKGWYRGNRFEVEARHAAGQDSMAPSGTNP